ncbi:MAG: S49 family peptidase [Desulforhopalus sp.]
MGVEHILTEIINRPLLITPDKLNVILGVLNKKADNPINIDLSDLVPALGSDQSDGAVRARAREVNQASSPPQYSFAVIDALGSLVYRNHGFGDGSGLRSYRTMQRDIQSCLDDQSVGGMLIDFDTYGGTAAGCERMARFIKEADSIKPIYGVVDLNCFSAGMYLAAACRKIILTDHTAGVGSIGCIAIHRDQSMKNEMDGIVYTAVFFGSEKNDYSPHEPLSPGMKKKLQSSVDRMGMQFAGTVAEFRGLELEAVLKMNAGVYYGQEAIDAGLADEIATFDEAVAMLAAEIEEQQESTYYGGSSMTTKERMEKLLTAEDGPEALAELGYVKKEDAETGLQAAKEGLRKKFYDVAELCQLAELSTDQTVTMLKEGISPDAAREKIQELRAEKSRKTTVQSTISPLAREGKHPLIESCEKLATK